MIIGNFLKNRQAVSVSLDADSGQWALCEFQVTGKKYHFSKVIRTDCDEPDLAAFSTVRASIITRNTTLCRGDAPAQMKRGLLEVQILEKIHKETYFAENGGVEFAYYIYEKKGTTLKYLATAIPSQDLNPFFSSEAAMRGRIRSIHTGFTAIASLVTQFTEDSVIALIQRDDRLETMLVGQGIPLLRQITPLSEKGEFSEGIAEEGIHGLLHEAEREFGLVPKRLMLFGLPEQDMPEQIGSWRVWRPALDKSAITVEDRNDFFMYPELLGIPFCPGELNLIPATWERAFRLQQLSKGVAALCAFGSLFLLAASAFIYKDNLALQQEYETGVQRIRNKAASLSAMIPDPHETQLVEKWSRIELLSRRESGPRSLMLAMTAGLPRDVKLREFQIFRDNRKAADSSGPVNSSSGIYQVSQANAVDSGTAAAVSEMTPQAERLLIQGIRGDAELVTSGTLSQVTQRFDKTIKLFSARFTVTDSRWRYDQERREGVLNLSFSSFSEGFDKIFMGKGETGSSKAWSENVSEGQKEIQELTRG